MDSTEYEVSRPNVGLKPDSLFERCHWLYALCREYLFRDHTAEISAAIFSSGEPPSGTHLLEIGCGPGIYARRFAQKYPQIETTGVDMSRRLIRWARSRATRLRLGNCHFCEGDAQALPKFSQPIDAVVVSRLFLIVPEKEAVLAEIFRVLRPGGRCFIAEPTSAFATRLPLRAMWLWTRFSRNPVGKFREPQQADVMSPQDFHELVQTQAWESVDMHHDNWYQYAVCVKSADKSSATDASAA